MNIFQTNVQTAVHKALAEKGALDALWKPVRQLLSRMLKEATAAAPGTEFKDSNGEGISLGRGGDKLEFRLDRDRRKVIRTSSREAEEREYDLDKLDNLKIEEEVVEFVYASYRSS
jgi:hypothetical protein